MHTPSRGQVDTICHSILYSMDPWLSLQLELRGMVTHVRITNRHDRCGTDPLEPRTAQGWEWCDIRLGDFEICARVALRTRLRMLAIAICFAT